MLRKTMIALAAVAALAPRQTPVGASAAASTGVASMAADFTAASAARDIALSLGLYCGGGYPHDRPRLTRAILAPNTAVIARLRP